MNANHYTLVFCTVPNEDIAHALSTSIVKLKLAACVNVLPNITSIYSWKEKIEQSNELLLIIKTTKEIYGKLEAFLQEKHPYDCPEIIAPP